MRKIFASPSIKSLKFGIIFGLWRPICFLSKRANLLFEPKGQFATLAKGPICVWCQRANLLFEQKGLPATWAKGRICFWRQRSNLLFCLECYLNPLINIGPICFSSQRANLLFKPICFLSQRVNLPFEPDSQSELDLTNKHCHLDYHNRGTLLPAFWLDTAMANLNALYIFWFRVSGEENWGMNVTGWGQDVTSQDC